MTAELAIAGSSGLITRRKVDGATPCGKCGDEIDYATEMEMYMPIYARGDSRLYRIMYVCRACFKKATYSARAELAERIRKARTWGIEYNPTYKRNLYRVLQARHGILPATDPRFNEIYSAVKKGSL